MPAGYSDLQIGFPFSVLLLWTPLQTKQAQKHPFFFQHWVPERRSSQGHLEATFELFDWDHFEGAWPNKIQPFNLEEATEVQRLQASTLLPHTQCRDTACCTWLVAWIAWLVWSSLVCCLRGCSWVGVFVVSPKSDPVVVN